MKISDAYKSFLLDRAAYCSGKTLVTYEGHLGLLSIYLSIVYSGSDTVFSDLPDSFMQDFVIWLRRRDITASSVRSYCRTIKAFLTFCNQKNFCPDLLRGLKLPKDDAEAPQPLLEEEVEVLDDLLSRCVRNYCIVHLMLDCGLRSSEVVHLMIQHVDFQHDIINVKVSKGSKSRRVLLPEFLREQLLDYLSGRTAGYLFEPLRGDGVCITENTIKQLMQDLKQKSGITRLHAHLLRHTFATAYLMGGGNLEYLRCMMGHTSYNVTQIYTSLAAECTMLQIPVYRLKRIC